MIRTLRIGLVIGFILLLASCNSTKYVSDGEYLLDKVRIDSDNKDYKSSELSSYLRQQPNFKVFGLMKWQLFVYDWSGRNEKYWVNKQLRRMGEPPVILDTVLVEHSVTELERFLVNKGYIDAEVSSGIDTSRYKKAVVTYHVKSNEPFRIMDYQVDLDDPKIDSIAHLKPIRRSPLAAAFRSAPDEYIPLVKEGGLFDRDVLDNERQRVTTLVRRRGYYAFNRDNLAFLADSSEQSHLVDIEMKLRPYRLMQPNGVVTDTTHRQYYVKDVTIVTDYNTLGLDDDERWGTPTDTVYIGNVRILYGRNGKSIRPSILSLCNYIMPGYLYNERSVEQTYSAFSALRSLRNVNIRFDETEENDTMKLSCTILTSPAKLQNVGVDLEGTNSAGDFGFATSLTYQHRNLFKGAELFSARLRGAYESLSGSKGSGLASYWELGGETSVLFPRFLFPFISSDFRRKIRASTEFRVSYNNQTRPEYERAILSGGWSYLWQDRNNALARHTFKLLDIDYVYLPRIDQSFKESLPPSTVLYNYSDHFIVGAGYAYTFNNYNPQNRQRNTHSLRLSLETAGNMLNLLSMATGAKKDDEGRYQLFGIDYAQFAKGDLDLGKGIVLDNRNQLAFHLGVGVAVPYANADRIPFERRYFSGGANSVRGWSVRKLGPGSMSVADTTSYVLQAGDVRLDANIEYRTKLFWKIELAAYIDAGNIWTIRPYPDQPGGNFDFSRFYKEIAVSYGLGLRLDFNYFLLRFDTGFKAYNPQKTGSDRWAITNPNLRDNFAWHFAVGYPF